MKNETAIKSANTIAKLLHVGAEIVATTPFEDLGFFAQRSVRRAAQARDNDALNPRIDEIILFGSLARGDDDVGDIDMFVFDHGFYSWSFMKKNSFSYEYGVLANNLNRLLTYWFGFPNGGYTEDEIRLVFNTKVDLMILPTRFLTDTTVFDGIANRQMDPNFFPNAMQKIMRFDSGKMVFVETDITYLEKKYRVDLSRLCKAIDVKVE